MSASCSTPTATASPRSSSTTASAPASDIIGPVDYRDGGAVERGEHVGALALGVDNMAAHPVQGRGVMIDLQAPLRPRRASSSATTELMRIMEADKVEVEAGDCVCFRTGYDRVILGMNKQPDAATLATNPGAGLDGRDERLLNWITRSGAVALISDNRAVEQMPSRPVRGRGSVRLAAAARALPVQARRLSR